MSASAAPILGAAGLVAAWWVAVEALDVAPYLAPSPPAVVEALAGQPGYLLRNAADTLATATAGYALAVATAVAVGIVLAISHRLERAMTPLLLVLGTIPKPAVVPLLIVTLGFGSGPKIVLVWMMCFFPIALATKSGLRSTPAELVELACSLTASRWQLFLKIRVPAALPQIFAGLRIALPLALIGAVVAELFGGISGLGVVIQTAGTRADLAWAAVVLLAGASTVLYYLLTAGCHAAAPWIRHTTA
ncbi:ABC transporter permease [Solwaraspora sp. WMMD1047]|uniref:ABC transporter permease n=1 Tax=Solwaraspora sp. WMMD1047 TaxID=3016102 RepID=UPI0024172520|nr:ABC transporter permease [Solwaraspora sp. WMMD1047]MDG4834847.1 ABC transporter permease [Solwaraspora sp. WMMD1047]